MLNYNFYRHYTLHKFLFSHGAVLTLFTAGIELYMNTILSAASVYIPLGYAVYPLMGSVGKCMPGLQDTTYP